MAASSMLWMAWIWRSTVAKSQHCWGTMAPAKPLPFLCSLALSQSLQVTLRYFLVHAFHYVSKALPGIYSCQRLIFQIDPCLLVKTPAKSCVFSCRVPMPAAAFYVLMTLLAWTSMVMVELVSLSNWLATTAWHYGSFAGNAIINGMSIRDSVSIIISIVICEFYSTLICRWCYHQWHEHQGQCECHQTGLGCMPPVWHSVARD